MKRTVLSVAVGLAMLASLTLAAPFAQSAARVPTPTGFAANGDTTKGMSARATSPTGVYIVQLNGDPLVAYRGGVANLRATNPSVIGEDKLDVRSAGARAYRSYLQRQREAVLSTAVLVFGARPDVVETYDVAFNGMALRLSPRQAADLANFAGVVAVTPEVIRQPQTDVGPSFISAMQKGDVTKPALFSATINGANEKPAPVASSASGTAAFTYNDSTNTLSFQIKLKGITPTGQHIHRVANPDGTGPVAYSLDTYKVAAGPSPVYVGAVTLSGTDETNLYAGKLYVNFHTPAFPAGEIRGDIVANKGEGMLVGIIDSGINQTHASFADVGGDGYDHTNPLGAGTYLGVCDPENKFYQASFACNDKLIGAYTFTATSTSPNSLGEPSPADDDGHGSHTASTTAGNVTQASVVGVNIGTVSGVAPHANIIAYDVCGAVINGTYSGGCFSSAIVAAIDQATEDGVDVINYSIGGDSRDPYDNANAPDALAFLFALNSGVLASVAAGNDGPDAGTIGSPSNAPWVMSVAATTHNRSYTNSITAGGTTYKGLGFSGPLNTPAQIVYAGNYQDTAGKANPLCNPFMAGTNLAGKIVICDRGVIGRVEKADNAKAAGAVGFVLTNTSATQSLNGDVYPIPGVHLTKADGDVLKAAVVATPALTGTIGGATRNTDAANGDIVAGFSSRGADLTSADVLKPDVAAPGVDIIAAVANTDAAANEFDFLSGTSMAAPHNAGAATLIRALHPKWSASEVRSALMLTAVTEGVRKEDGTTAADPLDIGAGRIDVSKAALSGLVLNERALTFFRADPFTGGDPTTLNLASVTNSNCLVNCSFTRTFSNTLDAAVTWNVTASGTGVNVTVEPTSFTIAPGATQTLTITADVAASELDAYVFGQVTLTPAAPFTNVPVARLPVAVLPVAADLPDVVTIETNTNTGSATVEDLLAVAISDLSITTFGAAAGMLDSTRLISDTDNGSIYDDLADGLFIKKLTVPADSVRFVTEVITTTAVDLDLYVHLDGFNGGKKDGIPEAVELICASATGSALERCDLVGPPAGDYIIVVQNWEGSDKPSDKVQLSTAVVPNTPATNFTVTGPKQVAAKTPFDLTVQWNLPTVLPGHRYYGAMTLATQPTGGVELGYVPVDFVNTQFGQFLPTVFVAGR